MPATTAAAVSRVLRKGGLTPVAAHSRDGIYVTGKNPVAVISSVVDEPHREQLLSREAARILTEAGYAVQRGSDAILYITREQS